MSTAAIILAAGGGSRFEGPRAQVARPVPRPAPGVLGLSAQRRTPVSMRWR